MQPFCKSLSRSLKVNVFAVEYPGYSVYNSSQTNAESILRDAEDVYKFITVEMKVAPEMVAVLGRSIGSGPAVHLASKYKLGALLLVTPFLSIREVARSLFGGIAAIFVKERFENIEAISRVQCPILFVHGT